MNQTILLHYLHHSAVRLRQEGKGAIRMTSGAEIGWVVIAPERRHMGRSSDHSNKTMVEDLGCGGNFSHNCLGKKH